MGFLSAFRRGLSGNHEYEIVGIQVKCSHCGAREFDESEALLNTAGLSFLDLDWANRSASVLQCKNCGHLEWFVQ